ncbi:MAG: hypothetical protein CME19_07280 [Gemmatimonadetes bacterium]|nr:hypothetical protein [Gemmatimonadota bacterium]|tara:strand:- start:458 stop:1243 length:786 start_codon:yes stop_codon:yes gene_type:complete
MLTDSQKREFVDRGFIKIPGAIPMMQVETARRAINHSIGEVGKGGENMDNNRSSYFCAELCDQPVITDLFNGPAVMSVLESLMGDGNVQRISWAKPYPRFPLEPGTEPSTPGGHMDGTGNGLNGTAKGDYNRNFTAFAVVYLMDLPNEWSGNFTVWPGSHRACEAHFKEVGHEVLSNGNPDIEFLEPPIQITGKAGDLILAHHAMIHTGGPNASPDVRLAVIARPRHVDVDKLGNDAYLDIWAEWPGVKKVLDQGQVTSVN